MPCVFADVCPVSTKYGHLKPGPVGIKHTTGSTIYTCNQTNLMEV